MVTSNIDLARLRREGFCELRDGFEVEGWRWGVGKMFVGGRVARERGGVGREDGKGVQVQIDNSFFMTRTGVGYIRASGRGLID